MAVFPARDREPFDAHWRRLLADDSLVKRTIVDAGAVAGNIGCWEKDGRLLVGYWVGREFWGRPCRITDGDLSVRLRLPKLREPAMRSRREYRPSVEEGTLALSLIE